jgi:hypothetical protein
LAHTDTGSSACDIPLAHQRIERREQIEVDAMKSM